MTEVVKVSTYLHQSIRIGTLVCLIIMILSETVAQSKVSDEYRIKAAFLYNLARMTHWPNEANQSSDTFNICFMGQNPFSNALDFIRNKKVRGRALAFQDNITLNEAEHCHLLFISDSERERWPSIISALEKLPILTVGDISSFAEQGGIVNLLKEKDKIQVEINLRAAKRSGLKISSRLLTLAKIIAQ